MNALFYDILISHAAMYPDMQPQDFCKLAFQNEFGCGHLIKEKDAAYSYLLEELENTRQNDNIPVSVNIGGGWARLNLSAVKNVLPPEIIFRIFEMSCIPSGNIDSFKNKLSLIVKAARMGIINFDADALEAYFSSFDIGSLPAHSGIYKEKYGASYRVIRSELIPLIPICTAINKSISDNRKICMAIDGRAASGKTTMAKYLSQIFEADVIHMDDFFLPKERKTPERLRIPGGNIDSERFFSEVYEHLHDDCIVYNVFDCGLQKLSQRISLKRKSLLIVEGVYSLLPIFRDKYDIKIFADTNSLSQKERILRKGGTTLYERYVSEWLPLEEIYFRVLNPSSICDIKLCT